MNKETYDKLTEFIDALETEYGDLDGFEVKLEHPIVDNETQEFATIKSFIIHHIAKTEINLTELEK